MDGFAVGASRDEIEESQQCVLIGSELLESLTCLFGGFADFDVTLECFFDHGQQLCALPPLEVVFDLFRNFQQAASELALIRTNPDGLFQFSRHGG